MFRKRKAAIRKGLIYGSVACLLWSAVYPIGRHLSHADPVVLAFCRFLIAGVALGLFVVPRRFTQLREAVSNDMPRFLFLALTGIFGMGLLIFLSLRFTISVNTGILINANPIFIVLLAVFIGEKITFNKSFGVVVGIMGCALVVMSQSSGSQRPSENNLLGCALALAGSFCWALYTVAGKSMVCKYGGMVATSIAALTGAAMLFVLIIVRNAPLALAPDVLGWIAVLGLVPTALGFFLWYHGLRTVEAGRLAPLQFIAPVGTAVIGKIALREEITAHTIAGMLLVFIGIYFSSVRGVSAETGDNGRVLRA